MRIPPLPHLVPLRVFGAILLLQVSVAGCRREENAPPPVSPAPAEIAPAIKAAGVNPPSGGSFTCWVSGSGFERGDKVLLNGSTEIATTFGSPQLVTFAGAAELLEGRKALTLVVVRPGTPLRSGSFEVAIPSSSPKG